jgi:UDP-glucuronate 4-epimerase
MALYLVTGAAGFIGYHVAERLLARGDTVVGLDNLNDYYDVSLKEARLARLRSRPGFIFAKIDLADQPALAGLFTQFAFAGVVNLAAQAGVRHSLTNPHAYIHSNIDGFLNLLEGCRSRRVGHLVFASSSSVYGANTAMPYSTRQNVDHPLSLYAVSKKANELMAHSYAHLYALPCTGLRFFTAYGPWGRPDMAVFLFTRAILAGRPIDLYGYGRHKRDFTYVDDIAEGVVRLLDKPPAPDPAWDSRAPNPAASSAPYRLYNLGHHEPVEVLRVVEILEQVLGRPAAKNFLPPQPGDMDETFADIDDLTQAIDYRPQVAIEEGLRRFAAWYMEFYNPASA